LSKNPRQYPLRVSALVGLLGSVAVPQPADVREHMRALGRKIAAAVAQGIQ
jgi:hypothetical protein